MPSKTSGSARHRRQRRRKMRDRYSELQNETPIKRTQTMYYEFGPFWAKRMLDDAVITPEENYSERNIRWKQSHPR